MSEIKEFISGFTQRKGTSLLFSTMIAKVLGFFLNLSIIRILDKPDFGDLTYAYTIVSFLMPFTGFGMTHSYLKFAPLLPSQIAKIRLFKYTLSWGTLFSFFLAALLCLFAPLISKNQEGAYFYIISFSLLIVSLFLFESVKNYFRVFLINKAFAQLEIIHALVLFVSGIVLSLLLGGKGYILALIASPLVISLVVLIKHNILNKKTPKISLDKYKIWSYGIFTGAGTILSTLIYAVDILSISYLMQDASELVADYRTMSLIPLNLMILPTIMLKTDFIKIVKEAQNKQFLLNYAKNFMRLFFIIGTSFWLISFFFGEYITLIFGEKYSNNYQLLIILSFGIIGAYTLRIPFSNILSALGWAKVNSVISIFTLISDIILNYVLISHFGLIGAAYATASLFWLSGIISALSFYIYIKRLKGTSIN